MTWDEITLESPSFNGANAGTMLRLSTAVWRHRVRDANPAEKPVGDDEAPVKVDAGRFSEGIIIKGQISSRIAADQAIWNPTIIEGVVRTNLASPLEFRDLLLRSRKTWWKEAAAGNWHNDGNPARAKGLCRIRLGSKWSGGAGGAAAPYYIYGYVASIDIGDVTAGMKDGLIMPFTLEFGYANVEST